jgi:predicted DNA-binding transcriptional regulator AlpA
MNAQKVRKLVGFEELLPRFGISDSRTTINRKMKKVPPEFPQCVRSANGARIDWYEDEVAEHIASLARGSAENYREKAKARKAGGVS